ncbi:MAG: hypothetical protein U9N40_04310 [Euryarchaeota archaeon]|nr:hypothetical protein [Euryarchaeota archaeon]
MKNEFRIIESGFALQGIGSGHNFGYVSAAGGLPALPLHPAD